MDRKKRILTEPSEQQPESVFIFQKEWEKKGTRCGVYVDRAGRSRDGDDISFDVEKPEQFQKVKWPVRRAGMEFLFIVGCSEASRKILDAKRA